MSSPHPPRDFPIGEGRHKRDHARGKAERPALHPLTKLQEVLLPGSEEVDRSRHSAGFSLIEAIIGLVLLTLIARFAIVNIEGIIPGMRTNEASAQTVAQLRRGRQLAIAQRRNIEVRFVDPNQIQLVRHEVPNGTTVISTVTLDNSVTFRQFDGIPDTPDSFGNGSALDFGDAGELVFLTDGTLVDDQSQPLSGSIFLGLANHPETARAVTILGATGRIRAYRWTGTEWIQ